MLYIYAMTDYMSAHQCSHTDILSIRYTVRDRYVRPGSLGSVGLVVVLKAFLHEPLNFLCALLFASFSFCCALLMNDSPLRAAPLPSSLDCPHFLALQNVNDFASDIMAYLMCEIKCCYSIYRNYFIKIK